MISLLKKSRRPMLAILPGFALFLGGCGGETSENTTTAEETLTKAVDETAGDKSEPKESTSGAGTKEDTASESSKEDTDPLKLPGTAADAKSDPLEGWVTDLDLARKQAAEENKTILMDFTGSDWCGACMQLHANVFKKKEFQEFAAENLVLLKLDFPRFSELPPALTEQNEKLAEEFGIDVFPTLILTDAEGRPVGKTHYAGGGPVGFISSLSEILADRTARDKSLAEAEKAKGVDRAKLLDKVVASVPEDLVLPWYEELVNEIIKLDEDDSAGLKTQYSSLLVKREVRGRLAEILPKLRTSSPEDILLEMETLEDEYKGRSAGLAQIRLMKLRLLRQMRKHSDVIQLGAELLKANLADEEDRMSVIMVLVDSHQTLKRPEKGIELLDTWADSFKEQLNIINTHLRKAECLLEMEQVKDADISFTQAVKEAGDNEDLLDQLKLIRERMFEGHEVGEPSSDGEEDKKETAQSDDPKAEQSETPDKNDSESKTDAESDND